VHEGVAAALVRWESFYVIVGTSGAALTGLQFVVAALVAESERRSTTAEIDAFATPTIVHFSAVLFLSGVLSAPWQSLTRPAMVLGVCGVAGIGYTAIVMRRARRQTAYRPTFEDWVWYAVLPFLAYAMLLFAAFVLPRHASTALFAIAATTLLLLFVGIRNAWDTVTYVAVQRGGRLPEASGRR
jgi:hypothetical protein